MTPDALMHGLPGEPLIRQGLADIAERRRTIASCLVDVCRSRLARAGLLPPDSPPAQPEPEIALYELLRGEPGEGDAYSRYNALLRELDSFASALDQRLARLAHG